MSGRSVLVSVAAAVVVVAAGVAVAAESLSSPGSGGHGSAGSTGASSDGTPGSPRSSRSLAPATSRFPAAGVCGPVTGTVLTIRIEPDAPTPRCASVRSDQWLRVVNRTGDYGQAGRRVTVAWVPGQTFSLRPGQSRQLTRPFGRYLARGVHALDVGPGARAEIWLR